MAEANSNEQKAHDLVAEAEKKLGSSKSFFASLFGSQTKQEEALECYSRAANLFKIAKKWSLAGQTFVKIATQHASAGSKHDVATSYVDAANCYKKSDPKEAVRCLSLAVDVYTDMGRFSIAAKHLQTIAETYEHDLSDLSKAIVFYEKAADYFRGEESNASANKCLLKVAQFSAQMDNFERAILIYEQVASSSLESALLKFSAKEYFFRAALCHMAVDTVNGQHAVQRYEDQYPAFADSREAKLLKELLRHLEEQDLEGFTKAVQAYDNISRLDAWYTNILLKIKKQIPDENDLC